jgi:hypothetical protein
MALALLLLLIDPQQPFWRIAILLVSTFLLADVVRKTAWIKQGHIELSIVRGVVENPASGYWRTVSAIVFVFLGMAIFGLITWPKRQSVTSLTLATPQQFASSPTDNGGKSEPNPLLVPAVPVQLTTKQNTHGETAKPDVKPAVKAKPTSREIETPSPFSDISDELLQYKAEKARERLQDQWETFVRKDTALDTSIPPAKTPKQRAEIAQKHKQLRIQLVSHSNDLLPEAASLRDELLKRFGHADPEMGNLKTIIARFADMADGMAEH